jgi:PRTRC genetic system ThiF family protein
VGPENVGRQNFAPAEIGAPKAWALMERYNRAFGLRNAALVEPFQGIPWPTGLGLRSSVGVVIGCVDNYQARAAIHAAVCDANSVNLRVWWLDAGNSRYSGQVLLGNSPRERPVISPLGCCTELPLPSVQHPELLQPDPAPPAEAQPATCAELAAAQSLMINQAVAAYAAQYVYRLAVVRDLDIYATYVDLVGGNARSVGVCKTRKRR